MHLTHLACTACGKPLYPQYDLAAAARTLTKASGLRVPKAIGDFIMLDILRKSGGGAVAVTDEEMIASVREVGAAEGLFVAPEGAATYAALKHLLAAKAIRPDESGVLFNTGAGVKYLECFGGG